MNYPGMREDIVEIFAEAQRTTREQVRRAWARKLEWVRIKDAEVYARQVTAAAPPIGVTACPYCGGALHMREGLARPVHIGICSR